MNSYLKGRKSTRWREREETDFREKHDTSGRTGRPWQLKCEGQRETAKQ